MQPLLSVIIPARQAAGVLPHSLAALAASDLPRSAWELIVVDDASTDGTAAVAGQYADAVIRLTGRARGPAYARNRGVEVARGEIIAFADADVCLHPDALQRFLAHFEADPSLGAVVGSYDTDTPGQGVVTQYRNLRHVYLRRKGAGDVDTFWVACGAVRRAVLEQVGHFDEWHYWRPQVEGFELGRRIRLAGHRIWLDPQIQCTHLREWSFFGMLTGDLLDLGVPWMRLLLQEKAVGTTRAPSISAGEKLNTTLTWLALLTLVIWLPTGNRVAGFMAMGSGVAVGVATVPIFAFFVRHRGPLFGLWVLPLQTLHYVVTGASVVFAWLLHQLVGEPRRDASDDALAEVGVQTWPPIPRRVPADAWQRPAKP